MGGDRGVWGVLGVAELEGWPGVPRKRACRVFGGSRVGIPHFRPVGTPIVIIYPFLFILYSLTRTNDARCCIDFEFIFL